MTVFAALLAGLAAALLVRPSPRARARLLFAAPRERTSEPDRGIVAAGALILVATMLVGWPWGTLAASAAAPLVRERVNRRGTAGPRTIGRQVPVALDLVAAALAAGRPPGAAVAAAATAIGGSLGRALDEVAARVVTAADPAEAWREAAAHPELATLARAIARAERSGSAPAGVVSRAADDLRRRRQAALTRRSRSGAVSSAAPLGLCFLPAFFLVGVAPTILGLVGSIFG